MKRFLIFALVGPPLGLVIIALSAGSAAGRAPSIFLQLAYAFIFLPFAYALGIIPALGTALIDWFLSDKLSFGRRIMCAGLAGLVATAGLELWMSNGKISVSWFMSAYWLIGALPAAMCSWLSGKQEKSVEVTAAH